MVKLLCRQHPSRNVKAWRGGGGGGGTVTDVLIKIYNEVWRTLACETVGCGAFECDTLRCHILILSVRL